MAVKDRVILFHWHTAAKRLEAIRASAKIDQDLTFSAFDHQQREQHAVEAGLDRQSPIISEDGSCHRIISLVEGDESIDPPVPHQSTICQDSFSHRQRKETFVELRIQPGMLVQIQATVKFGEAISVLAENLRVSHDLVRRTFEQPSINARIDVLQISHVSGIEQVDTSASYEPVSIFSQLFDALRVDRAIQATKDDGGVGIGSGEISGDSSNLRSRESMAGIGREQPVVGEYGSVDMSSRENRP